MYSGEGFIWNKVQTNETVVWELIAYDVLCYFATDSDETSSLKLLLVMEKNNHEAAERFGNALTKDLDGSAQVKDQGATGTCAITTGTSGRDLIREDASLMEISKHYYNEESTRHLACILLTDELFDDSTFLRTHIISDKVNWTQIALKVLNEWARTREISDSRTFLDAMERSNDDAARYFREALTCDSTCGVPGWQPRTLLYR